MDRDPGLRPQGVQQEAVGRVDDLLVAEVDLPGGVDVGDLKGSLDAVAGELGVGVTLREVESDEL